VSWPLVNLRRVAQLGTGHTPSRQHPEYWENCTIPWLTLADVWRIRDDSVTVIDDTAERISELGIASSSAVLHDAGTVVMSRTASVGYSAILGTAMATSQDFVTWSPGPRLDARFLLHALRGFRDDILAMRMGSTHQTIYMPDIERIAVPLPPVLEQRAIADFLDAETARIDALIAKKRRLIRCAETRFRSSRWTRVSGSRTNPSVLAIPRDWRRTRLKFLVDAPVGGSWGLSPGEDEADVVCLRVADFDRWLGVVASVDPTIRSISREASTRLRVRNGDLLLEKSGGGDSSPVGFVARAAGVGEGTICSNFIARLRPSPECDPSFVAHVFAALYDHRLTGAFIKQTTGIQNLDVGVFLSQPWAIPDLPEQRRISAALGEEHRHATELRELLQRQIDLLTEHRQAHITAAVTGVLDIPGAAA